mmetsp:Transcript_7765/g.18507  ORF Transcript_7765/g.18507 Transcript_7765/m.18507 type:complete len:213 (-) Transcript_7765:1309-1947(-)
MRPYSFLTCDPTDGSSRIWLSTLGSWLLTRRCLAWIGKQLRAFTTAVAMAWLSLLKLPSSLGALPPLPGIGYISLNHLLSSGKSPAFSKPAHSTTSRQHNLFSASTSQLGKWTVPSAVSSDGTSLAALLRSNVANARLSLDSSLRTSSTRVYAKSPTSPKPSPNSNAEPLNSLVPIPMLPSLVLFTPMVRERTFGRRWAAAENEEDEAEVDA